MRKIYLFGLGIVAASMMFAEVNTSGRMGGSIPSVEDDSAFVSQEGAPNVIDEVVWVVGDEPILKSDIETTRLAGAQDGMKWHGDPDCSIPEQIALQKLFLSQASLDSIEVTESEVSQEVEARINWMIQQAGSREKLEEYQNQTLTELRSTMREEMRNQMLIQRMKRELVKDITVTPADVRRYFRDLPQDSLPYVPTSVEVQIITKQPKVAEEEINRVKNQLREYTDRIKSGETSFATLARLYSEDGSARQGGELGYTPRAALDPTFASVAFNLTDPNKISKIVETEFGFHIIQLIDKRGERINVRHILLKPRISAEAIDSAKVMLDSLTSNIKAEKYTFDAAASYVSDDKDTRNNHGLMSFYNQETGDRTSKFRMQDLPTEVARAVERLNVGEISEPFQMKDERGKTVCAIIRLKSRTESHRATMAEDYQTLKDVVLAKRRADVLHEWVVEKIKKTYVRVNDRYKDCNFEYEGWLK